MVEIWKEYNRSYYYRSNKINKLCEISNYGRIKVNGEIINNLKEINGYYLAPCGGLLHRLVAKLFIPNKENKPYIDHINGDKHNNRVDNLRWVTAKENCNNPITKQRLIEGIQKHVNSPDYVNYLKGKHLPDEVRNKLSIIKKGVPRTTPIWNKGLKNCYSEETIKKMIDNRKKTKSNWTEEYKESVYKKISDKQKGNTAVKGRIHINNGIQSKMVYENELSNYLDNGWIKGRLKKKKR